MREQAKQRSISAYYSALIYAGLGEQDQAFVWLERACQKRAEIADRCVELALPVADSAAIKVGVGVTRIQLDGAVVIANRPG